MVNNKIIQVINCLDFCPDSKARSEEGPCDCSYAKTHPGVCGCNTADLDSDGDLVPDCVDGCMRGIFYFVILNFFNKKKKMQIKLFRVFVDAEDQM